MASLCRRFITSIEAIVNITKVRQTSKIEILSVIKAFGDYLVFCREGFRGTLRYNYLGR